MQRHVGRKMHRKPSSEKGILRNKLDGMITRAKANENRKSRRGRVIKPRVIFDPSGAVAMIGDLSDENEDDDDPANLVDCRLFCFAAKKTNDPDHPLLHEALAGPDRDKYLEGMEKEVRKLEEKGTWKIVEKSALKPGSNILQGTWALRRKRLPDGTISSYKARFCVRGDQQVEGVDYFDTYAPVVSWSTVRLLLTLAILKGWKTRQVDYTNAFVQANLKENEHVYVALPKCFILSDRPEVVLKLIKSLYGLKQAPLRWFERLRDGLLKRGFVQSRLDPCLF